MLNLPMATVFQVQRDETLPDGTKVDGIAYKDGFPDFDKYVVGGKQDISVGSGEVGADDRFALHDKDERLAASASLH
ncbi:hypothetical protein QD336_12785 [Rhizobium sp. BR 250]